MSLPPYPVMSPRVVRPARRLLPLLALLVSAPSGVAAATLNVPAQYATIQAAVSAAAPGDTVVVADGTYSGAGNRDIDFGGKSLTVRSASGDPARTVIDCGGSASSDGSGNHRGFYLHSGETGAVISGFTVKNGYEATDSGGGIYNYGTVTHCTITGSTSSGSGGGGVANYGTLTDCTISGNMASVGGGVYNGGGIYNGGAVINCAISGNTADSVFPNGGSGGGIYNDGTATNCTITGNRATDSGGGGVANYGTLTDCTISGNVASVGGGVYNGGSIYNGGAVINCAISGNTAGIYGGGVFNGSGSVTYCTITGNMAGSNNGAGFYNGHFAYGLADCIVYGDSVGEISGEGAVPCNYCDVQGGYAGTGNINSDPLFVNAAGGDLHLRAASPCIGAGVFHFGLTTDKDGKTRPNPPTIGAYEGAAGVAGGRTHLLWNNADGRVMLWSVAQDGSFTVHGFGPYADNAPLKTHAWSATALATGADGRNYVLWNNADGRVMVWTMDDAGSLSDAAYFGPYTDNAPQNRWSATAISVGPDNVVHLLWNNTDGRVMLWNNATNESGFTYAGYGPYTDDSVAGNPAYNRWVAKALATGPDNISRIVWNNADARVMLWDVDGGFNLLAYAGYGRYTDDSVSLDPGNLWSAVGVSVGPDNTTHLLWSNTDRRAMFWNVAPDFSFTLAGYGPYTDNAPQNLWLATALATGPDNVSHFLWDNTDNRAMLWGVDGGFSLLAYAGYGPYTDDSVSLDPGNLWTATAVSAGP